MGFKLCHEASEKNQEWNSVTVATAVVTIQWKNADTYIHIHG